MREGRVDLLESPPLDFDRLENGARTPLTILHDPALAYPTPLSPSLTAQHVAVFLAASTRLKQFIGERRAVAEGEALEVGHGYCRGVAATARWDNTNR